MDAMESQNMVRCGLYKQMGHNRRRCPQWCYLSFFFFMWHVDYLYISLVFFLNYFGYIIMSYKCLWNDPIVNVGYLSSLIFLTIFDVSYYLCCILVFTFCTSNMAGLDSDLHPKLTNLTMLYLQTWYHSDSICSKKNMGPLCCRHRGLTAISTWWPHKRIQKYLHTSGFYGVFRVCNIQLDWSLITALVEQ